MLDMKITTKSKVSFVICLILSLWIITSYKQHHLLYSSIRDEILEFTAPAISTASSILYIASEFTNNINNLFTTFEDNKKLKERNDFLEYYFYLYKQTKEENQELRKKLNFTKNIPHKYTTAQIIAKSNNYLHQELIIDAGSKQGIKKWQMVLTNNHLIGRVIEVRHNTASILLITDHDSRIPVIGLSSKIKFIAAGRALNDLSCTYLSDNQLEEGELVVTSYDNPSILPNIIIGSVFKKDDIFYIKPTVNLNQLEFVQILLTSNE